LGAPRRSGSNSAFALGTGSGTVRRPLLLHGRDAPRAGGRAAGRPADLARKLGVGCGVTARRPLG
jgi:hypothetical protein